MPRATRRQRLAATLRRQGFTPAMVAVSLDRFRPMAPPSKPRMPGPNRSQWRRLLSLGMRVHKRGYALPWEQYP